MLRYIHRKFYPRASEHRLSVSAATPAFRADRRRFFQAVTFNLALIQFLFFCLFCYLFGALFQQNSHTHALRVLWVDYDGGVIGGSVRHAYNSLRSENFPTLVERPISDFPTEQDLREAVCHSEYWAALFTTAGSSEKLERRIAGSPSVYNQTNVLYYIWNEAKYPTTMDSAISSNLQMLSNTARAMYTSENSGEVLAAIPANNSAALTTFASPWTLSSINIQPTAGGTRVVYNSICIVLVLIQDFFYLGSINGLYAQFNVYNRIRPLQIILVRDTISIIFTMVGSLLTSAAIWAFKDGWHVSGKQFALNWLILWLFAHVNFLALDVFTIWLPPQYVPMALINWIVTNVTSILIPFSLSSAFYRWAYALPAHEAYEALTDNWSAGCNPHLYYAVPILLAYEIVGLFLTSIGVYRRCHLAVVAQDAVQGALRQQTEMVMMLERQGEESSRLETGSHDAGNKDNNLPSLSQNNGGDPIPTKLRVGDESLGTEQVAGEGENRRQRSSLQDQEIGYNGDGLVVHPLRSRAIQFGPIFSYAASPS